MCNWGKRLWEWTEGSWCKVPEGKVDSWGSNSRARADWKDPQNEKYQHKARKLYESHKEFSYNNATSGELQNSVFFVEISSFMEGPWGRHLLNRTEQISSWTDQQSTTSVGHVIEYTTRLVIWNQTLTDFAMIFCSKNWKATLIGMQLRMGNF